MVKIISGYSEKGGSTTAFIDLTNEFNKQGIDTTFYGPHQWHLDKCKSGILNNKLTISESDSLIFHFLQLPARPPGKKVVLSCHEKWWFSVGKINQYWDTAVFLHQEHREYHKEYKGDNVIIPNLKPPLVSKDKSKLTNIAGVIGTIEDRKQTHISIERAIADGCEKVLLYGNIGDSTYYKQYVEKYIGDRVIMKGYSLNKQEMYDSIGRVYHSSKGEVACLVKDECYLTDTAFFGNLETDNLVSSLTNDEVIELWRKLLQV
jgi:hypothetical protein